MNDFNLKLIDWFRTQKRVLPWRNTSDPYKIWISEIMLQQTQVNTVIDYYNRFVELMPTVNDLATIEIDILLKTWEGLGYYSRARNMKKAAKIIVEEYGSQFPDNYKELLALPGIGPYTAGAIMSIAFNKPYAAIDGNVYRVIARYNGIQKSIKEPSVKKAIKAFVEENLSEKHARDYTESLMELGAVICTPNKLICTKCPIKSSCKAYNNNLTSTLPIKQKRVKQKSQDITIVALVCNNKVGIIKRNQKLLQNLYAYDTFEKNLTVKEINNHYDNYGVNSIEHLKTYRHVYTHLIWQIKSYVVKTTEPVNEFTYVDIESLEKVYSLPKAYKQLINPIKKLISK